MVEVDALQFVAYASAANSIERQRYYEVLRFENEGLLNLVIESLENSIETTAKFLDELNGLRVKRAS